MFVTHRIADGTDVVTLGGRIVMANAIEVRERIHAIAERGHGTVIVDMADVEFMDSSGLSVLVSVYERVQSRDARVVLAALTPPVHALVELTRLHEVFEIYDDTSTALEDLAESAVSIA